MDGWTLRGLLLLLSAAAPATALYTVPDLT